MNYSKPKHFYNSSKIFIKDYKSINQLLNNLNSQPKGNSHWLWRKNEIFNIYTGKMVSKTKFITLQHGNISDSHYWHDFIIESTQDLKLTWELKPIKDNYLYLIFKLST